MNTDVLKGKWLQFRGAVKEKWGDLTDDELSMVDGNFDRLAGILQERYGYTREKAQDELSRFFDSFDTELKSTNQTGH